MAATKKPKTSQKPKSMDISHPEATQAGHTARPIIVSNRPMIKDPMVNVTPPTPAENTPSTSPVLPTRVAKTITPRSDATAVDTPKPEAQSTTDDSDTAPELDDRQVPQLVKAIQREKAAQAEAAQSEESEEPNQLDDEAATEQTESSSDVTAPSELTDSADTGDIADAPSDATETPKVDDSAETDEQPEPSGAPDPLDVDQTSPDADGETATKDPANPDDKAQEVTDGQKEQNAQDHIQELIDQKTYYLPIKVAKKRHGLLVLLLVAGLAAAAYFYITMAA